MPCLVKLFGISSLVGLCASAQSVENTTHFNIELRFETPVSPEVEAVFMYAKNRWESVIISDVGTVVEISQGMEICGTVAQTTEYVDDLLIYVNVKEIDGEGQVLANAGPCGLDSVGRVRVGIMNFDLADLQRLIELGRAGTVVLHEMGHVLGFGTLWESKDLIDTDGWIWKSYQYQGDQGNIGNEEIGMEGEAIIEDEGGAGTAKSHWKEDVYTTELMTGFVTEDGQAPMSLLTVRSLVDLGYEVDISKADPFEVDDDIADEYDLKASLRGSEQRNKKKAAKKNREAYGNDVLKLPLHVLPETPRRR